MDPVADTSRYTAAVRARESERPDRLFFDPYARTLAGDIGFTIMRNLEQEHGSSIENPFLPIRTKYFDDFLMRILQHTTIDQIVILAAGMDARAYRLPLLSHYKLFELDRPELIALKNQILSNEHAIPYCDRYTIGADLSKEWERQLIEAGFHPEKPAIWLAEGFFVYLKQPSVEHVLKQVERLSASGSWLGADLISEAFINGPWAEKDRTYLKKYGLSWEFGTDEPERFLKRFGWDAQAVQPGSYEADYGRWPFPIIPRELTDFPKTFLVTAYKK